MDRKYSGGGGLTIEDTSSKKSGLATKWKLFKKQRTYFLILLPVLLFFVIFNYAPMYGVIMAFKDYKMRLGILDSPWADPWYKYFKLAFGSPVFLRAVGNTLEIAAARIIFAFPIPILLALLIDEIPYIRLKKTVQTISYLPYFISWVILSGIMQNILSPTGGAINAIVEFFGGESIYFLGDASKFQGVVFWSNLWKNVGYSTIVYLAAISGVDQEQVEAARLDGASRLQIVWHVTIPAIRPIIVIQLILSLRGVMTANFDQVFNIYSAVVYETGDIIETYAYRMGITGQEYGYSTAVGLFQSVVGLIMVWITNNVARRVDPDSALF